MTNNETIPQNMYRNARINNREDLFKEVEECLQAYYDLIDDCKHFPLWERKIQEDLGGAISFLAIQMEEASRDDIVEKSPVYERFDSEKQLYFK